MALAASLLLFLLSILVGIIGSFFFGNSFETIGFDNQNRIGGYIGLGVSIVLFILGALSLSRSHRSDIKQRGVPMNNI